MLLAIDVHYQAGRANAVCVAFEHWESELLHSSTSVVLENLAEYEPGAFYRRELPCILALLDMPPVPLSSAQALIVDGYVWLGEDDRPGLGYHVYEALGRQVPVVGVAKTRFSPLSRQVREVLRGTSGNLLFVTSCGLPADVAADYVRHMAGPHRVPTLLRQLDQLTRQWPAPLPPLA
ncbi:endonuclease V [Hymenobacter weizhouensis]|uniref:endonuclease V n=1 Tax=Hymenobacter sp. YIM 151500-1 TaxID=2987689 RepID=UPI002226F19A|nr:endonuclease V [Hymenobacter sp. YIM 151500-1]UYZ64416.1 endonuclease V [Hymenobacter sp. YIM 151500-1]